PPVVVLSDNFWRRRFGSDPQVIGRALTIDSPDYPHTPQRWTVIGIMPPGFRFLGDSDLWMPLITQGWSNVAPLGEGDGKVIYGSRKFPVSLIRRPNPGMTVHAPSEILPVIRDRKLEESDISPPVIVAVRSSRDTSRLGAPAQPINVPRERADGQI